MDSVITQLITLTTPGPLTYIMLFVYTVLYIFGVENIRNYFSLKIQSLKIKASEEDIIELEKKALFRELTEQGKVFLERYDIYVGDGERAHDENILDCWVEQILRKQQEFKKIMRTRESLLLKKRLEARTNQSEHTF